MGRWNGGWISRGYLVLFGCTAWATNATCQGQRANRDCLTFEAMCHGITSDLLWFGWLRKRASIAIELHNEDVVVVAKASGPWIAWVGTRRGSVECNLEENIWQLRIVVGSGCPSIGRLLADQNKIGTGEELLRKCNAILRASESFLCTFGVVPRLLLLLLLLLRQPTTNRRRGGLIYYPISPPGGEPTYS